MYIKVSNLTKSISKKTVLEDINFKFESGKIYGLRGKNGSGKTMLMRAICGLINPTKGNVDINGEILGKDISFPKSVGVLIENPGFIANYSGYKNLKVLASIKDEIDDKKIIETLSLINLDPYDKKKFKQYSLGMKQKLGIAAAIMEDPEIIILDEPINALDENSVKVVKEILYDRRDKGVLIIVSCHDKEELEYLSDEVLLIEEGKLIESQPIKK
jgi:ABC-2 type transport system ATP-binding protein